MPREKISRTKGQKASAATSVKGPQIPKRAAVAPSRTTRTRAVKAGETG
jgi:hypothetical protein